MQITKIGIVTARFNEDITSKLLQGAMTYLEGIDGLDIFSVSVPGAVEIPLACKALMDAGCSGVVALGAVIRGETSHYDYVCNSVTDGVTRLMLDTGKPIGFGVLTTENEEQALDRVGGKHGHKGTEAAQVVMEMVGLLTELKIFEQEIDQEERAEEKAASKASSKKAAKKAQPSAKSVAKTAPKKAPKKAGSKSKTKR